jgi:hypothetical protein
MLIDGKCHCGNIAFTLDWPEGEPDIPARACDCSFCLKHGGVWTSNPRARLSVVLHHADLVSKYAFGTETAAFHVCIRCGYVGELPSSAARMYSRGWRADRSTGLPMSVSAKGASNFFAEPPPCPS